MITVRDIAWAAGFMEGEGSFMSRCKGAILLECVQVQKEPLERLQKLFGGNLYLVQRKPSMKPNQQNYWRWTRMGQVRRLESA